MTRTMTPSTDVPRLSVSLREQTQVAHEQAETSSFVRQLLSGGLPLAAYTALVVQNHAIYQALETVAESWRGDPVAGPFVLDELVRLPRLEADLLQLLGPDWAVRAQELRVPATDRYVARLHEVGGTWAGGFVAHHYVRYLGDLSGGQVIRASIGRIYGDEGERSTGFYVFDRIEKIKPFRDRYRDLLDSVVLDEPERIRVVAEAVGAFELNREVFVDLAARHGEVAPSS